jgi:hypothetical protein
VNIKKRYCNPKLGSLVDGVLRLLRIIKRNPESYKKAQRTEKREAFRVAFYIPLGEITRCLMSDTLETNRNRFCKTLMLTPTVFHSRCCPYKMSLCQYVMLNYCTMSLGHLTRVIDRLTRGLATHLCLRGSRIPTSQMSRLPQWEDTPGLSLFHH